ncbi:hypothetical protein BDZ91DRAFT_786589 [Kalaharituber pfeilii]|nr:hypothetical protein BDZ91DRAFT_786589 [Kalaharituber pfeilii]
MQIPFNMRSSTPHHLPSSFRSCLPLTLPLLLLSLFTPPTVSEALPSSSLKLRETGYNPSITSPPPIVLSVYNLPEFLRFILAPSGTPVASNNDAEMLPKHYTRGFGWNKEEDQKDADAGWVPAGLATWEDASPTVSEGEDGWKGDDSAKDTAIVSWRQENNAGVRITIIGNATSTSKSAVKKYAHIYLVSLSRSSEESELEIHPLGGVDPGTSLVWHHNWLYVGNDTTGILAFDLSHIWKVNPSSSPHNATYVLPQARSYVPSTNDKRFLQPFQEFKFSFLTLDRSTEVADGSPSMLAGDWETSAARGTYMIKWPFTPGGGRLKTVMTDGLLIATATWAWRMDIVRVRGIAYSPVQKKYFIAQKPQRDANSTEERPAGDFNVSGDLISWAPDSDEDSHDGVLARGVAGLAYVRNQDELWMVGTSEGARGVVGVDAEGYAPGGPSPSSTGTTETSRPTVTQVETTSQTSTSSSGASADSDSDSGSSSRVNKSAIAGGVIAGGMVAIAICIAAFFFCRRHRRNRGERRINLELEATEVIEAGYTGGHLSPKKGAVLVELPGGRLAAGTEPVEAK